MRIDSTPIKMHNDFERREEKKRKRKKRVQSSTESPSPWTQLDVLKTIVHCNSSIGDETLAHREVYFQKKKNPPDSRQVDMHIKKKKKEKKNQSSLARTSKQKVVSVHVDIALPYLTVVEK